ncbi:MAG: twin-arginine translocase TatA/TatE family subunit [Bacteroidia bacterium]|nr:twin-arginine translocase TatA/TatE family subunit [Bacteroidia bacterium]
MNLSILIGFLGGMGGTEIFLIILVLLLFFGGKRIPELAKGLGRGIKEFKDASKGVAGGEEEAKKIEDKK